MYSFFLSRLDTRIIFSRTSYYDNRTEIRRRLFLKTNEKWKSPSLRVITLFKKGGKNCTKS